MSKQAEFAVILKMNPMFADLGADELQRISNLCHTLNLSVGEVLFQKGDPGNALYGVRRGQIRIETGASDGSRLTLNFMGPGDLFGEVIVDVLGQRVGHGLIEQRLLALDDELLMSVWSRTQYQIGFPDADNLRTFLRMIRKEISTAKGR